jgi:hypothetical protein
MGIDLLRAKKMAFLAGFEKTMLVAFAIASVGIFTSLVRGPIKKAKESEGFQPPSRWCLTQDVSGRII